MSIFRAPGDRGRVTLAAGVAALAHVSIFLVLGLRAVRPQPLGSPPPAATYEPIELSVVLERSEVAVDEHDSAGVASAHEPVAVRGSLSARSEPSAGPSRALDEAPSEAPPAGSAAPVTLFSTPPVAIGIAGDGPNPFVGAREATGPTSPTGTFRSAAPDAPTAAEAKRAVEHSLKTVMRARDVEVGLGPEGPVVRALEDATYGGLAPDRGNATFLAIVDARGLVVDVRLLSSSGGDWNDVRHRAARALAGKKIDLRGAKGAELKIRVDSDVRLPSGNEPGKPVRPTLSDSKVVLPENVPAGGTADVVKTYKVGTFDVTDVAAKPRRIVHGQLVSMTTL